MRTLPRSWKGRPRGDYAALCSICGVPWPRSRLVKKADGLFYCPDDVRGRDAVTLSRLNAERRQRPQWPPMDAPVEGVSLYSAAGVVPVNWLILVQENGEPLLQEDGDFLLLETSP